MSTRAFESVNLESTVPSFKLDSLKFAANSAYDGNSFNVADLRKAGADVAGYQLGVMTIVGDALNRSDDMDTVTSPKNDSTYVMRKENGEAMNEPVPLEEPKLTDEQKLIVAEILPKAIAFFDGGGAMGGNPSLLTAISEYLKRPELNGELEKAVVDYINFHLAKENLIGRISSVGGETYLGSLVSHPTRHYEAFWSLGKAVE